MIWLKNEPIFLNFEHPTLQGAGAGNMAMNLLGFQPAQSRSANIGEGLRRSTVAHFARKVRGTNIAAAKHELKIQQSHAKSIGHVRYVFVTLTLRAK